MLNKNLKKYRKKAKLSGSDCASSLNISDNEYLAFEKAKSVCNIEQIKILSNIFNVDISKLVDIDIASDEQLVKVLDLHNQIINDTKHKNKISYKLVIVAILILIIYMYFRIK